MGAPTKTFRPKWAKFVAEYIQCGNAAHAAVKAGFKATWGRQLLMNPAIIAEVDRLRKEIMADGVYGLKKAMAEIEDAMLFARQTENATALANLLQLRAKINGLIIDKSDHRISGNFQLNIEGIDQVRQVGESVAIQQITGGVKSGTGSNT